MNHSAATDWWIVTLLIIGLCLWNANIAVEYIRADAKLTTILWEVGWVIMLGICVYDRFSEHS